VSCLAASRLRASWQAVEARQYRLAQGLTVRLSCFADRPEAFSAVSEAGRVVRVARRAVRPVPLSRALL
jgi:hypothetical protein